MKRRGNRLFAFHDTGDNTNISLYAMLGVLSAAVSAGSIVVMKHKDDEE